MVAHAYNPSYLRGGEWENPGPKLFPGEKMHYIIQNK
jgi:hypothetical protein